ncbi:MAG: glycoside hydrolase family 99-like domain-containing protein, partial [Eubacteriales bacterium]|nr:glycoside hydrolase family 99-like domain-containing protein [Eubacteriales bacterium]
MKKYDVAAYIWPSYTGDEPRTRMFWPEGIGEWQTVHNSVQKFPGHEWPRKPVWGYVNEADRYVMEMEINAAADHGINVFIYDWYWYDRRPFLENCLNDGYLKARNNDRVKFYLMWANHNVSHLWDKRIAHIDGNIIWDAAVDRPEFERLGTRLIENYFSHPCYYRIGGKPVFMIYNLPDLIRGLGGIDETADAIAWLKDRSCRAGLGGLHLQVKLQRNMKQAILKVDPDADTKGSANDILKALGFESATHYQFCSLTNIDRDYPDIIDDLEKIWAEVDNEYDFPYFAHVSLGWDKNP